MNTGKDYCACGKRELDSYIGTYSDDEASHTRAKCTPYGTRPHVTHHDDCGCQSAALRAEAARWREVAEALASVLREWKVLGEDNFMVSGLGERQDAALARFDAMNVTLHANVQEPDGTVNSVTRDANAAILRLQKRLDAVRPVVKAAVGFQAWLRTFGMVMTPREYEPEQLRKTVDALPAADREWAQKGE